MSLPEVIDFEMRGGDNPDPEMNLIEKKIAQEAYNRVLHNPGWTELGFKRAYNFTHLLTFYMTRDPYLIRLLNRLEPYPSYIEMEMTQSICPLKCIMCELTYWKEKPIQLSFDRFKYAMDQFPELKWAGNNALGDPFTNKDCWKIWKYLDDKNVVQELYLTGYLLKPEDMLKFVEMKGLVFLKFSFDAATKETYETIRVNSDFDKVIKNILAFDKYKKEKGKFFPELQFHYIVMKSNIHETEKFIELIDSLKIDCSNIIFSRLLHNYKEINNIYTEIPIELIERLRRKGNELNIPVSFSADIPGSRPPANECTAWLMPYIFPDGTVISCCCMNEQNRRDWQRKTSMGNIFETPFRDIWNGEKYKKLRSLVFKGLYKEAHPVCEICNIYDLNKKSNL